MYDWKFKGIFSLQKESIFSVKHKTNPGCVVFPVHLTAVCIYSEWVRLVQYPQTQETLFENFPPQWIHFLPPGDFGRTTKQRALHERKLRKDQWRPIHCLSVFTFVLWETNIDHRIACQENSGYWPKNNKGTFCCGITGFCLACHRKEYNVYSALAQRKSFCCQVWIAGYRVTWGFLLISLHLLWYGLNVLFRSCLFFIELQWWKENGGWPFQ